MKWIQEVGFKSDCGALQKEAALGRNSGQLEGGANDIDSKTGNKRRKEKTQKGIRIEITTSDKPRDWPESARCSLGHISAGCYDKTEWIRKTNKRREKEELLSIGTAEFHRFVETASHPSKTLFRNNCVTASWHLERPTASCPRGINT